MKLFANIILSCFGLLVVQATYWDGHPTVIKNCAKINNVDSAGMQKVLDGQHSSDATTKQFILCNVRDLGWLGEDGKWSNNRITTTIGPLLHEADLKKVEEECAIVYKVTPEDTAFEFWKCVRPIVSPHIKIKN